MRLQPTYKACAIALVVIAAAVVGTAQSKQPSIVGTGETGITMQLVKTGLYQISAGGSNSLLRLSANGLILVDGNILGSYDALLAHVRKISKQPVRVMILTDQCTSDVGTAAQFIRDGTRIIAQEKICQNTPHSSLSSGKIEQPVLTYESEYLLKMGGVEVQLMNFGSAYTNGDTVVYFPNLKVVAVGDLFSAAPNPDFAAGGSLVNWGPVLANVLKLDFDVAVPSKGPTVSRGDLDAFKTKIDTLVSRATILVKDGVPKEQLMGKLKTEDLGWQLSFTPEQVDHFYAELSQTQSGLSVVPSVGSTQTSSQLLGWRTANPSQSIPPTQLTQ